MTISPTNHVRETILEALMAASSVTSLVPRLYPTKTPNNPVKPFGRYGSSNADAVRPSGWRGGNVDGSYHVFVAVNPAIPDPGDHCGKAVDAIAEIIDSLPDCIVDRTMTVPDGSDPDTHHGIVFFTYGALAEI